MCAFISRAPHHRPAHFSAPDLRETEARRRIYALHAATAAEKSAKSIIQSGNGAVILSIYTLLHSEVQRRLESNAKGWPN